MKKYVLGIVMSCLWIGSAAGIERVEGLSQKGYLVRDIYGVAHLFGQTEQDTLFLQGWAHAQDRLFQMDVARRRSSGTLAQLMGPSVLASDVEFRTIGIRRAAQRALAAASRPARLGLQAYARGVNAYIAKYKLPAAYQAIGVTDIPAWTVLDSLVIGYTIYFGTSASGDVARTETWLAFTQALGDVAGNALFFEDIYRSAPFEPIATIDSEAQPGKLKPDKFKRTKQRNAAQRSVQVRLPEMSQSGRADTQRLLQKFHKRYAKLANLPPLFDEKSPSYGSNSWVVAAKYTKSGQPILANDPHLPLGTPSLFTQNRLSASQTGLDVYGATPAGVPYVMLGQNRNVAWGATVNSMDVADIFKEQVQSVAVSVSALASVLL